MVSFSFFIVAIAMVYYSIVITKNSRKEYEGMAYNLSKTVAEVIDAEDVSYLRNKVESIVESADEVVFSDEWGSDRWNAYTARFDEVKTDEKFIKVRDFLRKIESVNSSDIDCLYLTYVDSAHNAVVYIVDSAEEDSACPPGCMDQIYDMNIEILSNPARGFPPYFTNTAEYGKLVTAGSPIYLGNEVVGYSMADISMSTIVGARSNSIVRLLIYLTSTVALLSVAGILIINVILIKPLKKLNAVANSYDSKNPNKAHDVFANLNINTHDELAELADSIKKMENDFYETIHELSASKQEVQEMTELANKDALTGVRNKAAYNTEIETIDNDIKAGKIVKFGIAMVDLNYLKVINDKYGHNDGDAALIKISNLVCTIFAHSPVFRIGGDEFVVILKNADYRRADRLVKEFNKKIDELNDDEDLLPAEKVSAAIGYSLFDQTKDTCVEDVFKRADKAMYERKHFMKNN